MLVRNIYRDNSKSFVKVKEVASTIDIERAKKINNNNDFSENLYKIVINRLSNQGHRVYNDGDNKDIIYLMD